MRDICIEVYLQFPAMNRQFPVRVSPREVYKLDRNAKRTIRPDGAVVYAVARDQMPISQGRQFAGHAS